MRGHERRIVTRCGRHNSISARAGDHEPVRPCIRPPRRRPRADGPSASPPSHTPTGHSFAGKHPMAGRAGPGSRACLLVSGQLLEPDNTAKDDHPDPGRPPGSEPRIRSLKPSEWDIPTLNSPGPGSTRGGAWRPLLTTRKSTMNPAPRSMRDVAVSGRGPIHVKARRSRGRREAMSASPVRPRPSTQSPPPCRWSE